MGGGIEQLEDRQQEMDQAEGVDKAEPIRIEVVRQGGIMHDRADQVVCQEQAIGLLQDPHRPLGPQGLGRETLVGSHLVVGQLKLPTTLPPKNDH